MSIAIHPTITEQLLSQAETGMGWQLVEFRLGTAHRWHTPIINAQVAFERAGRVHVVREASDVEKRRLEMELTEPSADLQIRVLSPRDAFEARLLDTRAYVTGAGPASGALVEESESSERFFRFSAFKNDLRVRVDGSVRPGTYVTTHVDGMAHVKTGMDAVRRYALPNPDPAVHRFYLRPPDSINVRRGTVQPAHGQPGGGDEVIFEDGAPARTKYKQDEIPPGNDEA